MHSRLTVAAGVATVLASIALYPLLAGGIWFWGGIGAVIVVGGISAATQRRAVPAAVCFLAALGAEFLYLNALFAHRQSWADVVPTAASLHHLGLLVTEATNEALHSAPPVLPRPGIVLVVVAGVGLVGALTDLLAVQLHRPAIAGLPLLVLFCVPLTTDAKSGAMGSALVFCAGVTGYLSLLLADGHYRLRLWGRVIHPREGDRGPDTRVLASAGRRIGAGAVILALFLPLLVPAVRAHQIFTGLGGGGSGGTQGPQSQASFPSPLDLLNTDLNDSQSQAVLSYRATGQGTPPYLQLYVLGDLTTSAWTMARPTRTKTLGTGGAMPAAPGLAATTRRLSVHEVITLAPGLGIGANVRYLPVPYPPRQVQVAGSWQVDPGSLTVHSTDTQLAGLRYQVTGEDLTPSPEQLSHADPPPAAIAAAYATVPTAFYRLRFLADRITAGQTSAYDKAVALQAWFHRPGNFRYSLKTHLGASAAALVKFLTRTKAGSCQQFAFGMAVLARLVGIPSRVVVGFTQGTFVGNDSWQVNTTDTHAWPELYFTGAGWLGFEPTPPNLHGPAGQGTATVPPYSVAQGSPGSTPTPLGRHPGVPAPTASPVAPGAAFTHKPTSPGGGSGATGASQPKDPVPMGALVIAVLTALLLTPGLTRVAWRRWRWRTAHDDVTRAHVAWRELCDDLGDHRITWQASVSPRALARRITEMLGLTGAEREALKRIACAEERACYAASPADSTRLPTDVAAVRRAVTRASARRARWSARIAPSSLMAPARAGLRHALDVFGWIDLALTRARARGLARHRAPRPHST